MPQLLHLRLGRFFERRTLGTPNGMATVLEMTARFDELAHRACRAIEWRSATEAWLDLGTGRGSQSPWAIADQLHATAKALLPVEVACGVAATKTASRAASSLATPSGLLVVLPGYEDSIIGMATRQQVAAAGDRIGDPLDAAPFRPSLVPRAIVRSVTLDRVAEPTTNDTVDRDDAVIASLVRDARNGLIQLDAVAATVRVQFASASGVREAFTSLPDPTALDELLLDAARPLGRRVLAGASGTGQLQLALSQLSAGQAQASLFGWRYDRVHAPRVRRFA
jgi:hypothetical protein